jgi:hypothetical protein
MKKFEILCLRLTMLYPHSILMSWSLAETWVRPREGILSKSSSPETFQIPKACNFKGKETSIDRQKLQISLWELYPQTALPTGLNRLPISQLLFKLSFNPLKTSAAVHRTKNPSKKSIQIIQWIYVKTALCVKNSWNQKSSMVDTVQHTWNTDKYWEWRVKGT